MSRHALALIPSILFLFALSGLRPLLAEEPSLDSVPRPEGAALESSVRECREVLRVEFRIPLPGDLTLAQIGDRAVERAEEYLPAMEKAGWRLTEEAWLGPAAELSFRKGVLLDADLRVHRVSRPMEGKMRHFVAFSFELRRRVPYEDVVGRDPLDVPRYPGSVRVRWMNLLGDFATKYLVVGSVDEVREFYAKRLPELGWEEIKGVGTLNYRKGGWKTAEDAGPATGPKDPYDVAENAIPTTLSLHLSEDEGLVEIGFGRSAGAPDKGKTVAGPVTPEFPPPEPPKDLITRIDPDEVLPAYDGLERTARRRLPVPPSGEEIVRYVFEKKDAEMRDALAIAELYLERMKEAGWELLDQEWYGIGRKLEFARGAVKIRVNLKAVGVYPLPERTPRITIPLEVDVVHPIPSRDLAGKDLKDVPRYPGSKRCFYLSAGLDEIVKFKAVGEVSEVERWFILELPKKGWTFSGNDTTGLLFLPPGVAESAAAALSSGNIVPPTLKVKIDDTGRGTVRIGMDYTRGD